MWVERADCSENLIRDKVSETLIRDKVSTEAHVPSMVASSRGSAVD